MTHTQSQNARIVNIDRLKGQEQRLYQHLLTGATINCFSQARRDLRIGYLNSRIAVLVKANVPIVKKRVKVKDVNGGEVSVVEYSLDTT